MVKDEQWSQFIALISNGVTIKDACLAVGVGTTTYYDKINPKHRSYDKEFADKANRAHVAFKTRHLQTIANASDPTKVSRPDWKASAWLLERKFPDEFSERRKVEVETNKPISLSWFDNEEATPDVLPSEGEQEKDDS